MILRRWHGSFPTLRPKMPHPSAPKPAIDRRGAPMAVLCPGTGMGIAGLKPTDRGWQPIASEGGHTSLAPLTDRELAAWQVLQARYGRVSVERVLSGSGIVSFTAPWHPWKVKCPQLLGLRRLSGWPWTGGKPHWPLIPSKCFALGWATWPVTWRSCIWRAAVSIWPVIFCSQSSKY